jgi:hypothetical protein
MIRRFITTVLSSSVALTIAACGGGDGSDRVTAQHSAAAGNDELAAKSGLARQVGVSRVAASGFQGYPLSTVIWPSGRPIGVCWVLNDVDFARFSKEIGWVRDAIEGSWVANSGVSFSGWQQCTDSKDYYGIRVGVDDVNPAVWAYGSALNDLRAGPKQDRGMVLNFELKNWYMWSDKSTDPDTIRTSAVHEFGHALGFAHEQNRPDTPDTCHDAPQFINGDTLFGAWDLESVMNYCNPHWNNDGKLSATDIEMVQRFYGKPVGTVYVAKYAQGATIGAFDLNTGTLRYPYIFGSTGLPGPGNDQNYTLRHMSTAPDGKRIYITVRPPNGGGSTLRAIDTGTNAIVKTVMLAEEITDLEISPDSRMIYALWKDAAGKRGLRIIDADTGDVTGNIPVPDAQLLAKPRLSNDTVYVLAAADLSSPQTIFRVSVSEKKITQSFPAGAAGYHGFNLDLSTDEKAIYLLTHAAPGDSVARLAMVDLSTAQFKLMSPFPAGTDVSDMQVLDSRRILLGTSTKRASPYIYDVVAGSTTPMLKPVAIHPADSEDFAYPYIFSTTGGIIFMMYQEWFEGESYMDLVRLDPRFDGTYEVKDLDTYAYELDVSTLDRPFTFSGPN